MPAQYNFVCLIVISTLHYLWGFQILNNQQEQDEFNDQSEELKEKQEMINELMENLMDKELKELLEDT